MPDDAAALEFEVRCVWESGGGWIGRTTAVEWHFEVPFCVISRTCVGMMAGGDGCHDLSDRRKDSVDPIDLLTKCVLFYVPTKILKSHVTSAVPIPWSLPA